MAPENVSVLTEYLDKVPVCRCSKLYRQMHYALLGICLLLFTSSLTGCLSKSLTALQISPGAGSTTIAAGQTSQFQAQGIDTEAHHATTTTDLTGQVTWQTSNAAVATISSAGLATGVSAGTATITASMQGSFGPVTATSNITVTDATGTSTPAPRILTSLSVIPGMQTVTATGETAQFIAIGTYSSGSPATQDMTRQVSWQSSDVKVAQINSSGLLTGIGVGQATITALAKASDGTIVSASGIITDASSSGIVSIPTLTVVRVGNGAGSVTGTPTTGPGAGNIVIQCGSGSECIGNFPIGTDVTLVATPEPGSQFDGWSANCTPVTGIPTSCTVTMNNNENVGAIFDPITR